MGFRSTRRRFWHPRLVGRRAARHCTFIGLVRFKAAVGRTDGGQAVAPKGPPFAGACEGFGCLSRLATRGGERRPVGLPLSRYFPLVKPLWGLVGIAFAFLLASCRADTWSILVLGLALLWQSHYPSHACPPGTSQHSVCLSSRKLLCCHLEYSCSWLGPSLAKPLSLAACMPLACFH